MFAEQNLLSKHLFSNVWCEIGLVTDLEDKCDATINLSGCLGLFGFYLFPSFTKIQIQRVRGEQTLFELNPASILFKYDVSDVCPLMMFL